MCQIFHRKRKIVTVAGSYNIYLLTVLTVVITSSMTSNRYMFSFRKKEKVIYFLVAGTQIILHDVVTICILDL